MEELSREEFINRLMEAQRRKAAKCDDILSRARAKYNRCDPSFAKDVFELVEIISDDEAYLQILDYRDVKRFMKEAEDMISSFPEKCSCRAVK